ncbi:MAG: aldehyde ferredoxin oxidoreductase family protein, partial [Fusobacteriaceae bacterium]
SAVLAKRLKENGVTGTGLPTYGTAVLVNILNSLGSYPTRNWQSSSFDGTETASGEYMTEKYLKGQHYCHRCTIGCGRVVERQGEKIGGPEYETIWAFSAGMGVKDFDSVVEANYLCNEMGLDTISTGCTIAAAMELYQKGYIKKDELGNNIAPEFGNPKSASEWIKKIGRPDSELAKNMAKGSYELCKHYGHPEISMSVKKLEMPAYDARGVQGIGLNYATTNRGGCHVRGYTISPEVLGVPALVDRTTTEGKALLVKTTQDFTAIIDSLGLCLFTSFELKLKDYTDIFNAITDSNLKEEELLEIGERIYNLERLFNQKAGMNPSEDKLPKRLLEEAIDNRESKGMVNKLDIMLPEYYKVRGWEKAFPTQATLKRLGL